MENKPHLSLARVRNVPSSSQLCLELLPSVHFRNRLIIVNNRLISINRIVKYDMSTVVCPFKEGGAFMKFLLNLLGIASLVVAQQFTHYSHFKSLFNHALVEILSRILTGS